MKARQLLSLILVSLSLSICLCSCGNEEMPEVDLSGCKDIAELATVECYYHNVAEIKNDGTSYLFGVLNVGYKKAWFEYRGSVKLGIDASQIVVSKPDESGVVRVILPEVKIIGSPEVDVDSISKLVSETGLLTAITSEEETEALADAQSKLLETAQKDETLKRHARDRAQILIEQYIVNVGEATGVEYTVQFEEASDS